MTVKQKQHLLSYLGYYTGTADGIWGNQSENATRNFQRDFMQTADGIFGQETEGRILEVISTGEKPKKQREGFWKEIQFFDRAEFRCTCAGRGCNGFPVEPAERLVRNAELARLHFGQVADVSSGVRCVLRNGELPGSAANSLHMRGKAMDFRIRGIKSDALCAYVKTLPDVNEAYAIDDQFVHMGVLKYERGN